MLINWAIAYGERYLAVEILAPSITVNGLPDDNHRGFI